MGLGLTILVVSVLTILAWASFWGALTSNVGMSRGVPASRGLAWGTVLGPIGLAVVMVRSRGYGKGLDQRKAAAVTAANKYGEKAKRSVAAWRDPATGVGSQPTFQSPSTPAPDPTYPPNLSPSQPGWVAPPALPGPDPIPSTAPAPPPTTWVAPPAPPSDLPPGPPQPF